MDEHQALTERMERCADNGRRALMSWAEAAKPGFDWSSEPQAALVGLLIDLRHWASEHNDPDSEVNFNSAIERSFAFWAAFSLPQERSTIDAQARIAELESALELAETELMACLQDTFEPDA